MFFLLLGGGAIYLLLGDFREALILLFFAGLSIVITVVQETRTERVLDALRNLASPRALVIREGKRKRIAGRDVVRGDLVLLLEGDRVPADARLIEARDLQADESLLTGESVPVGKRTSLKPVQPIPPPGGEDSPYVYSGSSCGSRQRPCRGGRDRTKERDGQDWPAAPWPRDRAAQAPDPDALFGSAGSDRRRRCQPVRHGAVWSVSRRMAGGTAGRHYYRHVDAAGGISGGADGLHGHGSLENLARPRSDPPLRGDRSTRLGDRAVHGQDGHADRKSDVRR